MAMPEWIRMDGQAARARLDTDGTLRWSTDGGGGPAVEQRLHLESEVLGLGSDGPRVTIRAFVPAEDGWCCGVVGGADGLTRVRRDYVLEMPDEEAAGWWCARLTVYMESLGRPRKLLIILNPFSGKKSALKIFKDEIKPLFEAAEIHYDLKETVRQNHAQEIAYKFDLLQYDGVVCVSGDGILVEVINGLLNRKDWAMAIKLPLGIIPAGTANGMAKSLLDPVGDLCSVPNATFAVIRGHKRALDVATIVQNEKKYFSVLSLTWGLVADIDIESERFRWMGSARMDLYALFRILNLRTYHGHLHFIPAPGYEDFGEPVSQVDDCKCEILLSKQDQRNGDKVEQHGYHGCQGASCEGLEWRSIDGPFVSVVVSNVPFSGEHYMPAPKAQFSDGFLDIIILKDSPKLALVAMMLKLNDGGYVKLPYVTYFKARALRLKTGDCVGDPNKRGILDSDGEVLARGGHSENIQQNFFSYGQPIQMTADKGLATIFSPKCSTNLNGEEKIH